MYCKLFNSRNEVHIFPYCLITNIDIRVFSLSELDPSSLPPTFPDHPMVLYLQILIKSHI